MSSVAKSAGRTRGASKEARLARQTVTEGSADDGIGATEALSGAIRVDTEQVRGHLDEMVRSTVEQTLNQLLDE